MLRFFVDAGISCLIALLLFFAARADSTASEPKGLEWKQTSQKKEVKEEEQDMADKDKLSQKDGEYLIEAARKAIEKELNGSVDSDRSTPNEPEKLAEKRGTFVTLTIDGQLRGCIGHIIPQESLLQGVKSNAINAAFSDPRFRPLTKEEWKKVKVEVSILTEPRPLDYSGPEDLLEKLRPGVDGVILKKGYHQATFLPQVWEQLPRKEEFLSHLCQKAGLEGDAWRQGDLEISTYQVQAFEE